MEPIVLRQLQRALQPALKHAVIDWGTETLNAKVRQAPRTLPALFDKERAIVYAFLDKDVTLGDLRAAEIKLKAQTVDIASTALEFELQFGERSGAQASENLVHRLAASVLLREYQDDNAETHKEEIIRLGEQYSLASAHTSFIAIYEAQEAVEGTMQQVVLNPQRQLESTFHPESHAQTIASVQSLMLQNIDELLTRGESLESLIDSSEDLSSQSLQFRASGKRLSNKSWGIGDAFNSMISSAIGYFSSPSPLQPSAAAEEFHCGGPSKDSCNLAASPTTTTTTTSTMITILSNTETTPLGRNVHARQFDQLVQLQEFKGNWTPSADLNRVFALFSINSPVDVSTLPAALQACDTSDPEVLSAWATAIALAVLEKHCSDSQDEWNMLAAKAQRWLRAFCRQHNDIACPALLDAAGTFITA